MNEDGANWPEAEATMKIKEVQQYWKKLNKKEKRSAIILSVLLIALPLAVILVQVSTRLMSRAFPITPPVTTPVTPPTGTDCLANTENEIIVYPAGSGENCEDLRAAVDAVTGSDFTIRLAPGTHTIPAPLTDNNLNIIDKVNLSIKGFNADGNAGAKLVINPRNSTYKGIYINNSSVEIGGIEIEGMSDGELIKVENSHDVTFSTLKLLNPEGGILQILNSEDVAIYLSEFNAPGNAVDIYQVTNFVFGSSKIFGGTGSLLMSSSSGLIINNLFTGSTQETLFLTDTMSVDILHNIIIDNISQNTSIPAVYVLDDIVGTVTIENNIIAYNTVGVAVNDIDNVEYNYNDIWSNTENFAGGVVLTGEGNISADPGLGTNPEYCIYRNSPTIVYGDTAKGEYMGWSVFCNENGQTPSLILNVKLQGITTTGPDLTANLYLLQDGEVVHSFEDIPLENTSQGIYTAESFDIPDGDYEVLLKPSGYLAKNLGTVTIQDGSATEASVFESQFMAGDFNNDNKINIFDVAMILTKYTALSIPAGEGSGIEIFDINKDDSISIFDIAIILSNYTSLVVEGEPIPSI